MELATGSGKTAIMAMLIWLLGVPKTLVLVGTRTLVKQNRREISEWLGEEVGEWSGRRKITDPNVVVGIVASLQRYDEFVSSRRLLLLDEVHHASADTWYRISMACPGSGRFGFSATAIKPGEAVKNWKLVSATGPRIPVRVTASDLIEQGYGARPYIYYWKFKAPRVPRSAGYPTAITDALVHCTPRNTCIVDSCNQLVRSGLKTLVLIERLDHLQVLLAGIRGAGIPCRGISGKMDGLTQEKALDWFRADSPRVLVATRVVGEGVNIPSIRAVVWAAAGQSYTKVLQAIGRAMRPTGDNTCIIVDFQDDHNPYLKQQYKRRRLAVSAERAFLVGTDGLGFDEFLQEVLSE